MICIHGVYKIIVIYSPLYCISYFCVYTAVISFHKGVHTKLFPIHIRLAVQYYKHINCKQLKTLESLQQMAEKSASYESLQHVSLQGSAVTTQEQLKACCKLRYEPRRVKNKGAILVIVCNYLIVSVFGLLLQYYNSITGSELYKAYL